MSELKSCPFCGRVPKIEECEGWGYFVICECGIEQSELYKQKCDAVKHWNRRKGMLVGKQADQMIIDEVCMKRTDSGDDLIKRSDAIKAVSKVDDYGDGIGFEVRNHCLVELELVPSADRPQGEWIEMGQNEDGTHNVKCNQCGNTYKLLGHAKSIYTKYNYRFCPHCGARMKRRADDDSKRD